MTRRAVGVICATAALALTTASAAGAAVVYFTDELGNVGSYDDETGIAAPVGDLGAFQVAQVIGLAWDGEGQRILLLDRGAPAVYAMDPVSGVATLLFDPGFEFQGGAVLGGALYGIDEETQTVEAFDLSTFADLGLTAPPINGHHHGVGIDTAAGQLYVGGEISGDDLQARSDGGAPLVQGAGSEIATIGPDGSYGVQVVTFAENVEDIEAYEGDFLLAAFSQEVLRVDGATGAISTFVDPSQVAAAGVGDTVSGVALASVGGAEPIVAVPTLGPVGLALLLALLAIGAGTLLRRRGPRTA